MPPLPSVPGVVKLIISSSRSDSDIENILHIGYSGSPPAAANLTSYLGTYFNIATSIMFNAEGSTDLIGVTTEAIDLSSDTGASATETFTATGTRTGDFAPASASVVTSWTIGRRYRGGHPRTYWPFGTAGTYEAGSSKLWDSTFIGDVETKVGAWQAAITNVTVAATVFNDLVNVSYVSKEVNPDPPYRRPTPVVDVITAAVVKQRICTQRRRLGKLLG